MTQSTGITIGIDVGTTSIKAHAFTLDGKIVGRASLPTPWSVLVNGQTEIDVEFGETLGAFFFVHFLENSLEIVELENGSHVKIL